MECPARRPWKAVGWASHPTPGTCAPANKPVAVIGAGTNMFGAAWAQAELRKALGLAGSRVLDQELAVPIAHDAFRDDGRLARGATRVRSALADLIAEVAPTADAPPSTSLGLSTLSADCRRPRFPSWKQSARHRFIATACGVGFGPRSQLLGRRAPILFSLRPSKPEVPPA